MRSKFLLLVVAAASVVSIYYLITYGKNKALKLSMLTQSHIAHGKLQEAHKKTLTKLEKTSQDHEKLVDTHKAALEKLDLANKQFEQLQGKLNGAQGKLDSTTLAYEKLKTEHKALAAKLGKLEKTRFSTDLDKEKEILKLKEDVLSLKKVDVGKVENVTQNVVSTEKKKGTSKGETEVVKEIASKDVKDEASKETGEFGDAGWPNEPFTQDELEGGGQS